MSKSFKVCDTRILSSNIKGTHFEIQSLFISWNIFVQLPFEALYIANVKPFCNIGAV